MNKIKKYLPYLFRSDVSFFGIQTRIEIFDYAHPFFTVENSGSEIFRGSSHQECENFCQENGIALEER